jgi:acetate kinase
VVFTGGIGENAAPVRARVLGHLGVLGLAVDEDANAVHGRGRHGRVSVGTDPAALVVPTDEELLVARDARDLIG